MADLKAYEARIAAMSHEIDTRVARLAARRSELTTIEANAIANDIIADREALAACVCDFRRQCPRHTVSWM